jgi:ribonucleoside-diphosphate reductase alpha chain
MRHIASRICGAARTELMPQLPFENALSEEVWRSRYRYGGGASTADASIHDSWERVSAAVASVETAGSAIWSARFRSILADFQFLPAGRIIANAGTGFRATLSNCFVVGLIEDSLEGILDRLKESAITIQWGGGIGCDFSTLRPRGSVARSSGTLASGPVSFMGLWDAMCATMVSTGARRGAMMGTLRCDHPDIEEFIDAKRQKGTLTNFNLSVQVTDEFMHAVRDGLDWPLVFPSSDGSAEQKLVQWTGYGAPTNCRVYRRIDARRLWKRLVDAAYDTAEPGVLFVDQINRFNNLYYREHLTATNPCGEVPLPPFGACVLGSINLAAFVEHPFSDRARLSLERIVDATRNATRFLDDVIDIDQYPFPAQATEARGTRRIGLGITALADALLMLDLDYASDTGRAVARDVMKTIRDTAYTSSIDLAREKGVFPYFDRELYLNGRYVRSLPDSIRDAIARDGIRNSHLLAIAPAGTISVLANNVSSGIEPIFALEMQRQVRDSDGIASRHSVVDHAYALWKRKFGGTAALPRHVASATQISPEAHLQMQAALQPLVDSSIAKTINVAESISRSEFETIYKRAFELGVKGCTVFRPNAITGSILSARHGAADSSVHCCAIDRETG